MIESGIIKMPSRKMFSVLFMQNGILWLIIALVGIVIFALIGCFYDNRFFILALIWIFMIIPMIVAFLYFFYGMKPLTTFNTIPHKLKFDEKIIVEFFTEDENGLTYAPQKDYVIDKFLFNEIKIGYDYVILSFKNLGWLWLPIGALNSIGEMQELINDFKK